MGTASLCDLRRVCVDGTEDLERLVLGEGVAEALAGRAAFGSSLRHYDNKSRSFVERLMWVIPPKGEKLPSRKWRRVIPRGWQAMSDTRPLARGDVHQKP